jgi:hypothetical protein
LFDFKPQRYENTMAQKIKWKKIMRMREFSETFPDRMRKLN